MILFERYKKSKAAKTHKENKENAECLFQVREFHGELWLTYNDNLVCPFAMLKDEPVDAINKMRGLYIQRKEESQNG